MRIPRLIHQSWKTTEVPQDIYPHHWQKSWRDLNPDWTYRLWTDEDNQNLVASDYPQFLDFYESLDAGIKKADFCRFLYLHRFGGLYVDMDYICLKEMTPLLYGASIVIGRLSPENYRYQLPNAFMASEPENEFWLTLATDAMNAPQHEWGVEYHAGPFRLEWGIHKYRPEGLRILDQHFVYPLDWISFTNWNEGKFHRPDLCDLAWKMRQMPIEEIQKEFPQSFAVTTWNHNW